MTVITCSAPTLPVSVPVPTPVQVTATPPTVSAVLGVPSVTVKVEPVSTSEIPIVPDRTARLVVSGVPVMSGLELGSPSSDTLIVDGVSTGASLVPKMVIVTLLAVEVVPSLA